MVEVKKLQLIKCDDCGAQGSVLETIMNLACGPVSGPIYCDMCHSKHPCSIEVCIRERGHIGECEFAPCALQGGHEGTCKAQCEIN
jgi:hypothetical protein